MNQLVLDLGLDLHLDDLHIDLYLQVLDPPISGYLDMRTAIDIFDPYSSKTIMCQFKHSQAGRHICL